MKLWLYSMTARVEAVIDLETESMFEDVSIPRMALREALKKEPRIMPWVGCKATLHVGHPGAIRREDHIELHVSLSYWDVMCRSPRTHLLTITQL